LAAWLRANSPVAAPPPAGLEARIVANLRRERHPLRWTVAVGGLAAALGFAIATSRQDDARRTSPSVERFVEATWDATFDADTDGEFGYLSAGLGD
jgi:hypothetical protein